ncbi:MAG: hypothetical protein SF053_02430 [Bacteroidia bacterium]|nr:hypothetical protein [Bacteroidia bacterium]
MSLLEALQQSLTLIITQIAGGLPRLGGALLLLLLGWLLARGLSRLAARLVTRLGADRIAQRLNETSALKGAGIQVKPDQLIRQFVYWTLMLIFILSAADTLQLTFVSEQLSALIAYVPQLMTALLILGGGFLLADKVKDVLGTALKSMGVAAWRVISLALFAFLVLLVTVTALDQAGIDTSLLTANISLIIGGIMLAFALAYGYAARDVLTSMLATLYSRHTFQAGLRIEIGGETGIIEKIDNVSCILITSRGKVVIPASRLVTEKVVILPAEV